LALQVGPFDDVSVDQDQSPHTRTGKLISSDASQRATAKDGDY
jgi:hypothetical protein